jgi:uncharacterized protein (TIGR00661 family)
MSRKNFNISPKKQRILVAPLDWGLGHATRCIPIIKELLEERCEVLIAAKGSIQTLLQREFPELIFLPLDGYKMHYNDKKTSFRLSVFLQLPKLIFSILNEHIWLKKIVKRHKINAVISDNRFGLYHSNIPSIYITHQLSIKTGNKFLDKIAQKIHYWFINKYSACWVPDFKEVNTIAGDLSHPDKLPLNVQYLGCLSRFEKKFGIEKKYNLLIILSGPEPQRTIFEKIILKQLQDYKGIILFIRGLPGTILIETTNNNLEIINHLAAAELNIAIEQADLVISRSGYTTIMDLIKLQQKAILVPTPGQTEQEYLAQYLMQQNIFYCDQQDSFSLNSLVSKAENFSFAIPMFDMEQYKNVIRQFTKSL